MKKEININRFLDNSGKIIQLPQKFTLRIAVLSYLAEKFDIGVNYTEKQVNSVCDNWHTFNDYFILRRELVDNNLLCREPDGSKYWREG